jgi:hypothetical protein
VKRIISKARSLIAGAPRKKKARTIPRDRDAAPSPSADEPVKEGSPEPETPEDDTIEALENSLVDTRATGEESESRPQTRLDRGTSAGEPEAETPPEREVLIRSALAIQRRQSKVFANLSAEERRKLRLLASKLLMGNDSGKPH